MAAIGFQKIGEAKYTNGQYIVHDLYPRNVLKDEKGTIYVVDNIVKKMFEDKNPDYGDGGFNYWNLFNIGNKVYCYKKLCKSATQSLLTKITSI